jgi:hypothetical protein
MAHLFIRVELRGSPSWQDYENLHAYMENKNWHRTIQGTAGQSSLPHAMYHGQSDTGISDISSALRNGIEAKRLESGDRPSHVHPKLVDVTSLTAATYLDFSNDVVLRKGVGEGSDSF